jgi:hypothetical protein
MATPTSHGMLGRAPHDLARTSQRLLGEDAAVKSVIPYPWDGSTDRVHQSSTAAKVEKRYIVDYDALGRNCTDRPNETSFEADSDSRFYSQSALRLLQPSTKTTPLTMSRLVTTSIPSRPACEDLRHSMKLTTVDKLCLSFGYSSARYECTSCSSPPRLGIRDHSPACMSSRLETFTILSWARSPSSIYPTAWSLL